MATTPVSDIGNGREPADEDVQTVALSLDEAGAARP
jgi:hypothetical protein